MSTETLQTATERRRKKIDKGDLALSAVTGAVGLAAVGMGGLLAAGIGESIYKHATGEEPSQIGSAESKAMAAAVANGQEVPVLQGSEVKIDLTDKKFAKIKNPMITSRGHVVGIDKETGKFIVFYNGDHNFDGSGAAQKIEITEDGKTVDSEQAISDAKPMVLKEQKTKDGYVLETAAQGRQPESVGQLEQTKLVTVTTTTTETVPDN